MICMGRRFAELKSEAAELVHDLGGSVAKGGPPKWDTRLFRTGSARHEVAEFQRRHDTS